MSNLTKQLNKVGRDIKPNSAWATESRSVLLSQIGRGRVTQESHWFDFVESFRVSQVLFFATRPMSLVALLFLFLFGGSVWSVSAANQAKPGDALYIAKILSERAKFATTFDEAKKAKLNVEFASKRAEEIKQIKAENKPEQAARVAELTSNIKAELEQAQVHIISTEKKQEQEVEKDIPVVAKIVEKVAKTETKKATTAPHSEESKSDKEKSLVRSANLEKLKVGIDYYDPRQAALEKVRASLAKQDYDETVNNLKKLNETIDKPVVEVEKKATSSEPVGTSTPK